MRYILLVSFIIGCLPAFSQKVYKSASDRAKRLFLPDGSELLMNVGSSVKIPADFNKKTRTIFLAGDAFLQVKNNKKPFIIKTGQLIITTNEATLRVDAYPAPGEEADVLTGTVKVKKSYYSKLDNEEYELSPGQMVMINKEIDLIEKEKYDSLDLKSWLLRFR